VRFGSRRSGSERAPQQQNQWFSVMLMALLLLYWLFARHLERIDLSPVLEPWWHNNVPLIPLGPVTFVVEMLHPRVLRHLLPVVAGWLLADAAAVSLIQTLYDLKDRENARHFLGRLRSARNALGAFVKIKGKTFEADRENSPLLRVGGPGAVRISDTEVAVTETNGRFRRILGPGGHLLGRFETIYAVLDLRQQARAIDELALTTKDGIEIKVGVSISYRVSTGGEPATRAKPFPYDEEAVRLAAYAETVMADDETSNWEAIPAEIVKQKLTKIIAKYYLNDLLYPRSPSLDPRLTIHTELERLVRAALRDVGIELVNLHIGRLELPQPIFEQYIEYWQTHWETQTQLTEADGQAYSLEEVEVARAEAEVTMIRAIVEGLQRARLEGNADAMPELIALRLIEALEKVAEKSQESHPLPTSLLPELTAMREQLMLETG
jgi:hypothetical protein